MIHRPTAEAVAPWNACKATIREQRGAALGKVLATFVQIRQVGDESTPRLTLARREVLHPCHKRLVGEVNHRGERGGIHGSCIPSGCRTPQECPGCAATAPALPRSLGPAGAALGRFWHTTEASTPDSSRPCRSRSKTCQAPRSCDENVLLDATRSGPSCKGCLDPGMWDYWWALEDLNLRPPLRQRGALPLS